MLLVRSCAVSVGPLVSAEAVRTSLRSPDNSPTHKRDRFGLLCCFCETPEIHVRCGGKIAEGRPHCDRLVELLRINLVERVVGGVMGVEIVESVLAQRYYGHAGFLQFTDIVPAKKGWPAIEVGAERRNVRSSVRPKTLAAAPSGSWTE